MFSLSILPHYMIAECSSVRNANFTMLIKTIKKSQFGDGMDEDWSVVTVLKSDQ